MNGEHIILTGYSGFLGKYMLKELLKSNVKNKNFLTLLGRREPKSIKYAWQFLDFEHFNWIPTILPQNREITLLHFASKLPHSDNADFTNVMDGEISLLEKCKENGVTKVVYVSTGGVYGFCEECKEDQIPLPYNNYAEYKLVIEKKIQQMWPCENLILRLFFPYGPKQKVPRLIPTIIQKIMDSNPIYINGETGIIINPVYVIDAIEAISYMISNNIKGIYNIAGRENICLLDIINKIAYQLNKKPIITHTSGKDQILTGSVKLLLSINNNFIKTTFDSGIESILNQ